MDFRKRWPHVKTIYTVIVKRAVLQSESRVYSQHSESPLIHKVFRWQNTNTRQLTSEEMRGIYRRVQSPSRSRLKRTRTKKEFTVGKKTQLPALHTSPFRSNRTQTLKTIQMLSHKAIWRHLKITYLKPVVKQCQHLSCNTEWQNYQWLFYFAESQKQANTNWKPSDKNPFKQRSFQKLATE